VASVFVDAPAICAVLDRDDPRHQQSASTWADLLDARENLITSNYVVAEACGAIQRRLGLDALRAFLEDVLPVIEVRWITPGQHAMGLAALVAAQRSDLTLVDCTSFIVMRAGNVRRAFVLGEQFAGQGFEVVARH